VRNNCLGSGSTAAKLISTINETYSCMSFDNPIPDFVNVYSQFESGEGDYEIKYTCRTSESSDSPYSFTMIAIVGLLVLLLLAGVGTFADKLGQKKNAESLQYSLKDSGDISVSSCKIQAQNCRMKPHIVFI